MLCPNRGLQTGAEGSILLQSYLSTPQRMTLTLNWVVITEAFSLQWPIKESDSMYLNHLSAPKDNKTQ